MLQTTPTEKKEAGLQPVFAITVEDPQKVGDPIRAFIMYTVHTKARSVRIRLRVAVLSFLPDHFSGIFQAFVFCSSPVLRLPVAV